MGLFVFGERSLEGFDWIPDLPNSELLDNANYELMHEQGFFEDGSGDNAGFGDNGRMNNEDISKYRFDNDIHYDDRLMRDALDNIQDGEYSNWPWDKNNCQDWADRLREEYRRLEMLRKKEGGGTKCH